MRKKLKSLLPFALCLLPAFLLLLNANASAAAISPREGLETARRGFAGMTDFTADITQEKQIALLKRTQISRGRVRFLRPDTFYMEVDPPFASRMLLKDNVLTMLLTSEAIRQKTVLPPEEGLRHWFALLDRPVARLPEGVDIRAERSSGAITLRIIPAAKKGVKELKVTLYEDGRPRRLVIEEQNRDRTVINFLRVKKNVGLTEKDFRVE